MLLEKLITTMNKLVKEHESSNKMLEIALKIKNKGNELFYAGKYKEAYSNYQNVINFLEDLQEPEVCVLIQNCISNCCLVAVKMKDFHDAVSFSDRILEKEPNNEKMLYKKAEALYGLDHFQEANKTFKKVLDLNPTNKLARQKMNLSKKKYQSNCHEERLMYSEMFK